MKQADLCESTERSSLPREMEFGRRCRRTTCHAFCGRYLSFDRYLSPVDASLGKSSLIGSRDYFASWTSVADFRLYASFRDFARPAAVFRLPSATCSDRCGLFIKRERERDLLIFRLRRRITSTFETYQQSSHPHSRDYSSV